MLPLSLITKHWQGIIQKVCQYLMMFISFYFGVVHEGSMLLNRKCNDFQCILDLNDEMLKSLLVEEKFLKLQDHQGFCYLPIRGSVIKWMMSVHNNGCCSYRCLFLGIKIMDNFLFTFGQEISSKDFDLVASASLLIASKFEESNFIHFADRFDNDKEKKRHVIHAERVILKRLGYNFFFDTQDNLIDLIFNEYSKILASKANTSKLSDELYGFRSEVTQFELVAAFDKQYCSYRSSFVALCVIIAAARMRKRSNVIVGEFVIYAIIRLNKDCNTISKINKYAASLGLFAVVYRKPLLKCLSKCKVSQKKKLLT